MRDEDDHDGSEEVEDLPDLDYADPLKREDDRDPGGLDPALTIPPED
ncbi:MAG TPA: hypothetical protein VFA56_05295 [Gaiellaceae bacterium]|nr:hypothetical protein [Gaiellaceae bacterium]